MSASEAMAAALRLLTRQSRSEQELRGRLLGKGYPPAEVDQTLHRCRQLGYIDDERYALERCRMLRRQGRAVGWRLQADLRQRGIDEELARRAAETSIGELSAEASLAALVTRKFSTFSYRQAADREKRRVIDFLLRRGFSRGTILSYFQTREDDCCHHDDR